MAKKKIYQKKAFESDGNSSDTSSNIYMSMLMSTAWQSLSKPQQVLYMYCKAQYYAEKKKPDNNPLYFTMNKSKWNSLYNLYTNSNSAGFYRDIKALIEKGFIICVESGAITRTKSIYSFSSMWQKYETNEFKVLPNQMTLSMQRELNN